MQNEVITLLSGNIIEEEQTFTLAELCRCCALSAEQLLVMIEDGVVEPLQPRVNYTRWQFPGDSILRIQAALRLQRDLNVNLAGAVLALELLDEIKSLRQSIAFLQRN